MQWFQDGPGVVRESLRVAHCVESIDSDGTVRSWCRRTFQPTQIEQVADPTIAAQGAFDVPPCAVCVLRFEAVAAAAQDGRDVVPVHDDGALATLLRKAQWLLDDAAFYLPEGRCNSEDCELLAKTLDQLAALLRERTVRRVVIDPSAG